MLKLKKTAVAVLALGSSAVFAGTMGPVCAPGNVTIPCERTAWDVGAQALYLQPTVSGNLWSGNAVPRTGGGLNYNSVGEPSWGWGFQIEGSYHYSTGNDINVNWYHVNNGTSKTIPAPSIYAGRVNVHPEWDQVNVEFGQQIDFSDMKNMRLHAGVEYARVARKVQSTYRPGDVYGLITNVNNFVSNNASYNGFGPRFGMDLNYGLGNGFSAFGNAAGSILIGPMTQNVTGFRGTDAGLNANAHKINMVPELEGKLGARYDYAMAQGDLSLDIGYMWFNYFNGVVAQYGGDLGNFGENGLFFGLKWVGSV